MPMHPFPHYKNVALYNTSHMYLLLAGDTTQLGNVYAIAFLSVMSRRITV